jgi:hypothetical protein
MQSQQRPNKPTSYFKFPTESCTPLEIFSESSKLSRNSKLLRIKLIIMLSELSSPEIIETTKAGIYKPELFNCFRVHYDPNTKYIIGMFNFSLLNENEVNTILLTESTKYATDLTKEEWIKMRVI